MTEPDYLLFIASQVLTLDNTRFMAIMDDFSSRYEVIEMIKPNKVSLGGRFEKETGFLRWCAALREERVNNVRAFELHRENASLSPAIAHAFAGNQNMFLTVTTAADTRTFGLQTFSSSRYAISPQQFVDLINHQPLRQMLWARVATLIKESNELNHRPAFDKTEIEKYIVDGKGIYDFDFIVGNLFDEMQVELNVNDAVLLIPAAFDSLFFKPQPSDYFAGDRNIVFLYCFTDASRVQLFDLLAAQPFPATDVWQKLTELIKSYGASDLPELTPEQWPQWLAGRENDQVNAVANTICRAIAEVCEAKNIDRVIPENLKTVFGPDDTDNKRAKARGNSSDKFYLADNAEPWRMYFFDKADLEPPTPEPGDPKAAFGLSLDAISDFAKQMNSAFQIPFELAAKFLRGQFPPGDFSPAHWEIIKSDLMGKGYDDRAIGNVERSFHHASADLLIMKRPEKIPGMIALDLADVFGGMGSWNDQYVEDEAARTNYERVTAQAFASHRAYFSALISQSGPG